MKIKILLLVLFILTSKITFCNWGIIIEPNGPHSENISGNMRPVKVTVTNSPYKVISATAMAINSKTDLMPESSDFSNSVFSGTLVMDEFSQGKEITITVIATDILGNKDTAYSYFYYYIGPRLNMFKPTFNYGAISPFLDIKASSYHANGIAQMLTAFCEDYDELCKPLKSVQDTLFEQKLDLSEYDGQLKPLYLVAESNIYEYLGYDKLKTTKEIYSYVTLNPYLQKYFQSQTPISQVNNGKLTENPFFDDYVNNFYIHDSIFSVTDIATGNKTIIPKLKPYYLSNLFLTVDGGLIFTGVDSAADANGKYKNVYLSYWNKDSLRFVDSTQDYGFEGFKAAEKYIVWGINGFNTISNVETGEKKKIVSDITYSESVYDGDLTKTGKFAYTTMGSNIRFYDFETGTTTKITDNSINKDVYTSPLTDGKNIVYTSKRANGNYAVLLYNGDSTITLADFGNDNTRLNYKVNNGYIAYLKPEAPYYSDIWLRDSTGNEKRITSYKGATTILYLSDNGEMVLNRPDGYYLYNKEKSLGKFGPNSGRKGPNRLYYPNFYPFASNGEWYYTLGSTLFKVDTTRMKEPIILSPVYREVLKDSAVTFNPADFNKAYKGPGSPLYIKITGLPKHGKLNKALNDSIFINSIADLKYVPYKGYHGKDTFYWNAYNSVNYAVNDTTVQLSITAVLPVKLASFSAQRNGKVNRLNWVTSQEINSSHFEIERSTDGRNFSMLGRVEAKVNSSTNTSYAYDDRQPLPALNYYRLKTVDKDGQFDYSEIRTVNNAGLLDAVINPNPVKGGVLKVRLSSEKPTTAQLVITGVEGKVLYTQKLDLPGGITDKNISIATLQSGTYFVRIQSAEQRLDLKFVKAE